MDPGTEAPSLANRLAEARVELRRDLEVSRHIFRGVPAYVVRDPVTFGSHKFSADDYAVLCALRVDRTLHETFEVLVLQRRLGEDDEERFFRFVFSLHKLGLLKLPIADEKSLYRRHEAQSKARRARLVTSVLFWRVPLVKPNGFLERTIGYVRPLFSRGAMIAWCLLVVVAGWVIARNWADFSAPVLNIFTSSNLPLLWVTLVVLKVAHELGHAYATKYFGGHVPEMGAYFIVGTPCAYVDATASWGFSRKRERLFVCIAGMYVEIGIGALAAILWSVTPPGSLQSVLHNVIVLSTVVTVAFNINPLMRYDGYYALSDLVEVPNLRQRSHAEGARILKRVFLGVRSSGEPGSVVPRLFLLGFGFASAIYKVVLVLGISALIATKFFVLGLFVGGAYVLTEVVRVVRTTLGYLWRSEETASVRGWAVALSALVFAGIPLAVAAIPVPTHVTAPCVVTAQAESVVRAQVAGFLHDLAVEPGARLASGDQVAALFDVEADMALSDVDAHLAAARLRHGVHAVENPALAMQEEKRILQLEEERSFHQTRLERLVLCTPIDGVVVSCLDTNDIGLHVRPGEAVATVLGGPTVVRALLTEEGVAAARPQIGQRVEFRSRSDPSRVLSGTILRAKPAGMRKLDERYRAHLNLSAFAINPLSGEMQRSQFEFEVVLHEAEDARLLWGMTGRLRLPGERLTIATIVLRKVLVFADRLRR